MATAPTASIVLVDEYLNTGYHPDREYIDGLLVDRAMPTPVHAALQALLAAHLRRYREEFAYGVLTECRVEMVRGSRYRIPDVLLCGLPVPRTKTLESVPLAIIEIWSPEDRIGQQLIRFREYWERGVREIVVLEPETFDVLRYQPESLTKIGMEHLEISGGRRIPFPANELFNELRLDLD